MAIKAKQTVKCWSCNGADKYRFVPTYPPVRTGDRQPDPDVGKTCLGRGSFVPRSV